MAKYRTSYRRRSGRRKLMIALVVCLIVLAALAAAMFIYPMLLPRVDPFDYINVEFSGDTGSGTASVVPRTDLVGADTGKIRYTLSKDSGLVQGEAVTVTAESRAYRLTEYEKTYNVSGLNEYLTDAADLSDAAIMLMHEKSEAVFQLNFGDPSDSFGVTNELASNQPVRLWLLTSDSGNILYDVYKASFRSYNSSTERYDGPEKTVFLVAHYENVKVNPLDTSSFTFDTCMYDGDVISLGSDAVYDSVVTGYASLKAAKAALIDGADTGKNFTYRKLD